MRGIVNRHVCKLLKSPSSLWVLVVWVCLVLGMCGMPASALGTADAPAGGGVDLVREGKACADIVVPAVPSPIVEYAAKELPYHVRRATGCQLEIVKEDQPRNQPGASIYLGQCAAARKEGIAA